MADKLDEQLSALMDGECEHRELELALRRLAKDETLQVRWQRYHLIGDVIRNYVPQLIDPDFSERVKQAVAAEEPMVAKPIVKPQSFAKPLAGFGLAASVALLAVFGLQSAFDDAAAPQIVAPEPASASVLAARNPEFVQQSRQEFEARLNDYVVNHNELASMNSVHGMLPYVRIVGYQPAP